MTLKLEKYGTIISDKEVGNKIFNEIHESLIKEKKIVIDFSNIKSMATFCAKQIFGRLYLDLSSEAFFDRIEFLNVDSDLRLIIKIGIQNILEENTIIK